VLAATAATKCVVITAIPFHGAAMMALIGRDRPDRDLPVSRVSV